MQQLIYLLLLLINVYFTLYNGNYQNTDTQIQDG